MCKKILSLAMVLLLIFGMSACGSGKGEVTAFDTYADAIDTKFSKEIINSLQKIGDDGATGNRAAGSPGEHEAAEYLYGVMSDMGLANVTKDETTADGWVYKGANLKYKDEVGKEQTITLGGYATTLKAENEEIGVVYLGDGTEADYEGIDVKDKLVLIDIDQMQNWWINYPAYQAKLKGAKAVLAMSIMPVENEDRIGSQDICGPDDAPAFGISQKDSKILQELIAASPNKEARVVLNADTEIIPSSKSYNVWGEIPGKSEQVVYYIGHYDGYYHSTFDNASGIATSLGIVKAIKDSGYEPEKTIRIVAHGAEEFGKSGAEYDWATGAFNQITKNHPEWAETAFAVINIDGGYPIPEEKCYVTESSYELAKFVEESAKEISKEYGVEYRFISPATTGTEDFGWTAKGIPSIVAAGADESIYYSSAYHSNMDSEEALGFDDNAFLLNHKLYGQIFFDLDALAVRPMDFANRFDAFIETVDEEVVADKDLTDLLAEAKTAAEALNVKIADANTNGIEDSAALNTELFELYKVVQDQFLRLSHAGSIVFPHEAYQENIAYLNGAIAALEEGNVQEAYDEYLSSIDFGWYNMFFDKEVCTFFQSQKNLEENRKGTWGEGLTKYPPCEVGDVVRSLGDKYEADAPSVDGEIATLKQLLAVQEGYLSESVGEEKAALKEIIKTMKELAK